MILSGIDEKKQNEDATYIRILDTFSGKESEATKQIEKVFRSIFFLYFFFQIFKFFFLGS